MRPRTFNPSARGHQAGFTLIVGLIMLVLLTLSALVAFKMGSTQTQVVTNAQHRAEGLDAAQQAIDTVINSKNFTSNPAASIVHAAGVDCATNSLCVNVSGSGTTDYKVKLEPQPKCVKAAAIPMSKLDISNSQDLACITQSQQQTFGVANAAATGSSLCANSTWEVTAVADDEKTGASVTVVQGVNMRIATTDMTTYCP